DPPPSACARGRLAGAPRPATASVLPPSSSAVRGAPAPEMAGTSSPCSPITATVWPTSTSPSATAILSRTPDASASTSCVTFSVSSSYSGSPLSTVSPSAFSQRTIVPDSMPCPRRGSLTSVAIPAHGALDRRQDVVGVRHDELLHDRRERQRRELRTDALDRGVEPVEGLVLDDGGDLRAEAHLHDRLVRDDAAVRLLDRGDDRVLVERLQRSRVDDLDRDALLPGLAGRLQRLVNEPPCRDDGDILALAQ